MVSLLFLCAPVVSARSHIHIYHCFYPSFQIKSPSRVQQLQLQTLQQFWLQLSIHSLSLHFQCQFKSKKEISIFTLHWQQNPITKNNKILSLQPPFSRQYVYLRLTDRATVVTSQPIPNPGAACFEPYCSSVHLDVCDPRFTYPELATAVNATP